MGVMGVESLVRQTQEHVFFIGRSISWRSIDLCELGILLDRGCLVIDWGCLIIDLSC